MSKHFNTADLQKYAVDAEDGARIAARQLRDERDSLLVENSELRQKLEQLALETKALEEMDKIREDNRKLRRRIGELQVELGQIVQDGDDDED